MSGNSDSDGSSRTGSETVFRSTPSIKPTLVFLVVVFAAGLGAIGYIFANPELLGDPSTTEILLNVVFLLWILGLARLLLRIYVLRQTTYTITDRAVRREYDLLFKKWSRELPLVKVRGHDRKQTRLQRLLNIGTISFLTAGTARSPGHLSFEHVSDAGKIRRTVRELIEHEQRAGE